MKQVSLMVCLATTCAVLFVMLSSLAMAQTDKDHLVTTLPGYKDGRTPLPFKSYTGYLLANQTRGHYLFYWFFEAQTNSDTAPLVFWTNGGPGCSSLGGEASEHGFLLVNADGSTLRENPYSWNRKANVLYIEQPIGVGFSYSNQTSDYGVVNDVMAASDMANAYRDFISRFPKFLGREVFLSGESYGGVYVPTTALEIIQGNQNGKAPYINLKGILVGNGVTDAEADSNSIPAMMKYHSLISIKYYEQGYAACKGDFFTNQNVPACAQFLDQSNNIMGNINPYYIYDSCPWLGITSQKAKVSFQEKKFNVLNEQGKKTDVHPLFQLYKHGGWSKRVALQSNSKARVESDSPCVPNQAIAKYFKRLDVQKALGVQHGTVDPNGWDICTNVINYTQVYQTILPFYAKLLQHIRILVFTGDVDMVVNSYGTQAAIDKLQLQETSSWRTWEHETVTGTVVGGYIRKFGPGGKNGQGLTFVTIRGGGHMVPLMKPEAALTYFSKFLDGDCC